MSKNKEVIYWTTKEGKNIDVDEMSIEHLRNVLKMIIKQSAKVQKQCPHNNEQAMDIEPYAEDYMWK